MCSKVLAFCYMFTVDQHPSVQYLVLSCVKSVLAYKVDYFKASVRKQRPLDTTYRQNCYLLSYNDFSYKSIEYQQTADINKQLIPVVYCQQTMLGQRSLPCVVISISSLATHPTTGYTLDCTSISPVENYMCGDKYIQFGHTSYHYIYPRLHFHQSS